MFCHAADAGVVVGGLVVRQAVLQKQEQHGKPAVSANVQAAEESTWKTATGGGEWSLVSHFTVLNNKHLMNQDVWTTNV